ncbi:hypothetical protein TPL01_08460 [Sulfuriferula plumbiphila]|uniref:Small-conductance mechanosensitive channel n=1 Tax=Sulfuriferula plumbiphila TaxID=171865 RepID=A0A512L5E4_9PROT|nr:mechanosensitive ion channel domain-containing protein [Sulfuriferula plumbiphila]BBP03521.1 hypothetical protein SFPGR_09430 [Sulfuriferula plumbiphila]GEP29708.1 hypothetical protein TPL01_08460 [Sulfuriferula plumbiphila]
MSPLLNVLQRDLLNPATLLGAAFYGLVFLAFAMILGRLVRRFSRRVESHFTDVTGIAFASAFAQVVVFLVGFILYAHLIPELRALGTTLLAGVSVVSVVLGLAAQNTLSNLIAGFSLVLYRPISVGDSVQLSTPKGLATARLEQVSLGYSHLRDTDGNEIIVPNSVMISTVMIRVGGRKT